MHEKMAKELNDDKVKLEAFIRSEEEVKRTVEWLERVRIRMQSPDVPETENDRKYLSRFEFTKTCKGEATPTKWIEWIEPLILQSRHPFSYAHTIPKPGWNEDLVSSDYVLFASSNHLRASGRHKAKSYFIDAGKLTHKALILLFKTNILFFDK